MNNPLVRATGFVYLVLYAVSASTSPIALKIGFRQEASVIEIIAFRMMIATVLLWAYFLCFKQDAIRIDRKGFIGSFHVAIANCLSTSTYYFALSYLDASFTLIIHLTAFIPAVMLLLMMQGEYPSRLDLFRAGLALIGIYLFIELLGNVNLIGVGLAVSTAFFYALYMTLIQLRLSDYDSQTVTLYVITFMGIIFTVIYLAVGYRWPQFDAVTWGAILWLVIVGTALTRFLLFVGIKKAGSRQAALIAPLESLSVVLLAVWLLGESLTPQQWMGALLVIASVALGAKAKSESESDRERPDATKATEMPSNAKVSG